MKSIHSQITSEYGKDIVKIFHKREKLEYKMADFSNHRRFTLRCLSKSLIPVSVRLKSNIKTPEGKQIIRKAERALLNERVRSINNSLAMLKEQRDTCINNLSTVLDEERMKDCESFIMTRKEARHQKTLKRQVSKFERLCHKNTGGCTNIQDGTQHEQTNPENRINTGFRGSDSGQNITPGQGLDIDSNSGNIWVRNLSKTPLTKAQEQVLAHGPNFAIVPKVPPVLEYKVAIKKACQQLKQGEVEELTGEIKSIIKKISPPTPNISKEEHQAIQQLKKDNTRMILTADKGVCMVVMDKDDYIEKSEELLLKPTYKILSSDPTTKHKKKLIALLKSIKAEGGIKENTYRRLYPTGSCSLKYYGLPKVHKTGIPLRPIVSSIGSISYETTKELSKILKPLVGKTPYSVKNTEDFIQSIKDIRLQKDECMVSYDMEALFTSVPVKPAIAIIQQKM